MFTMKLSFENIIICNSIFYTNLGITKSMVKLYPELKKIRNILEKHFNRIPSSSIKLQSIESVEKKLYVVNRCSTCLKCVY